MADSINQFIELINIGVAVLALFAGAWVVLLLAAIGVRALVRQLGLAPVDDESRSSLMIRRSGVGNRESRKATTVSEVAS